MAHENFNESRFNFVLNPQRSEREGGEDKNLW